MTPEIDLRSDTVTKPSAGMRAAIANAEVGDDVIGSDPTVEKLQEHIAGLLGKESALFMPSGTMANQIAIRIQCQPGDEFLCEANCHVFRYEQGAFAQLSGLVPKLLHGQNGILHPEQFPGMISPDDDHALRTSLVALENTHNRGGGTIQPLEHVDAICNWARHNGLATHLDGARLFNAVVASGIDARRWAAGFDSISVCFSKGLGAPVGSALVGSRSLIRKARRARKLFGGGMRQVGIIAAGALYALENNISRLAEDHVKAKSLAAAVEACQGLRLEVPPATNIVLIRIDEQLGSSADFVSNLAKYGVGALPFGPQQIRLVTHLDVSFEQIERACDYIRIVASDLHSCSRAPANA